MKKTKAQLNGFGEKISTIMVDALPAKAGHSSNFLPTEIASRIVTNVELVKNKAELRDQILLVLSDYRQHLATGKTPGVRRDSHQPRETNY